jgi:hypothetical protein
MVRGHVRVQENLACPCRLRSRARVACSVYARHLQFVCGLGWLFQYDKPRLHVCACVTITEYVSVGPGSLWCWLRPQPVFRCHWLREYVDGAGSTYSGVAIILTKRVTRSLRHRVLRPAGIVVVHTYVACAYLYHFYVAASLTSGHHRMRTKHVWAVGGPGELRRVSGGEQRSRGRLHHVLVQQWLF